MVRETLPAATANQPIYIPASEVLTSQTVTSCLQLSLTDLFFHTDTSQVPVLEKVLGTKSVAGTVFHEEQDSGTDGFTTD